MSTAQNTASPHGATPGTAHMTNRAMQSLVTGLRPRFEADANAPVKITVRSLNFYYGPKHILKDINLDIREKQITALIGPSGSGKTSFLRILNRMSDVVRGARAEGTVKLGKLDVLIRQLHTSTLFLRVAIVR